MGGKGPPVEFRDLACDGKPDASVADLAIAIDCIPVAAAVVAFEDKRQVGLGDAWTIIGDLDAARAVAHDTVCSVCMLGCVAYEIAQDRKKRMSIGFDDHIGGHSVDERQPFDAYIRLQACPRVVDACLQFHASRLGSLATAKRACRLEDVGHCIDHG